MYTSYCNIKTQFEKLQQQNIAYKMNLGKQMRNSISGPFVFDCPFLWLFNSDG